MKARGCAVRLTLLAVMSTVIMISQVQAGTSCHRINAKGFGQATGGTGLPGDPATTEAQIVGGGLLQGATDAGFTFTDFTPPVFPFDGSLMFTTNRATLTVFLTGTLDLATGVFMANGPVVDATGKLEGATGSLIFEGVQNLADGTFVETVTGQICVDLAP